MKNILIYFGLFVIAAFSFSCEELEPTPEFSKSEVTFTASASVSDVAATAADSLKEVISFTWSDPEYAVGLEKSKFSVRAAASGTNFAKYVSKEFAGVLTGTLLGKEVNGMAMTFGGEVGEPIDLDFVVVASQENNNEPKMSDVFKITVTPFADLALNTSVSSIVLDASGANEEAIELNWSAAFKGFDAVKTYELQYAEGGTDFGGVYTSVPVTGFNRSFTQAELNDIALGYGYAPNSEGTIDFRVRAQNELGTEVFSNVITIAATPYATSFPPLYAMGAALKGWGPWPDSAVELVSKEYKKYETIAFFKNGEAFRFFEQLDWNPTSYNYPYFTSVSSLFENAGDGDSNLRFVGATGWVKVNVDLVAKTVTAEEVTEPVLFMTGAALNGWNWDNPIQLTRIKYGVFEAVANFSNESFRFFGQAGWDGTSYNYPYFESVHPDFQNANDGDSNLRYIGTPGIRKVTVDLFNKTVELSAAAPAELFMTGAALNGWNWDNPIELTLTSPGVFKANAFFNNDAFRFFKQADWGDSYNYPYFAEVDADFENANDGDLNFRYIGTPGVREITVDFNNNTVTLGPVISELFMTGAALNGWNWDNPVELTNVGAGVFEATATFTSGEAFRFFAQADWSPTSFNYPYFTSVAADFENAADGDSNLRYVGATGSRKVIVNLVTKTVTLE